MVKVSVIIPIIGEEQKNNAALDSIRHQTMKDVEVVCVSDEDTVSSEENTGIMKVSGEYVLFLHPDNILLSTALENLYQAAEDTSADIVAFSGVNVEVRKSEDGKETAEAVEACLRTGEYTNALSGKDMMCLLVGRNAYYPSVSLQLYRKAYLLQKGIWFSDSSENEEQVFTFRSYLEAERVCAVSEIYLYHRMEADAKKQALEKQISELQKALDDAKKQLKEVSEKKNKLESSRSYRIGKKVTSIPRKAKKAFGNNREKK